MLIRSYHVITRTTTAEKYKAHARGTRSVQRSCILLFNHRKTTGVFIWHFRWGFFGDHITFCSELRPVARRTLGVPFENCVNKAQEIKQLAASFKSVPFRQKYVFICESVTSKIPKQFKKETEKNRPFQIRTLTPKTNFFYYVGNN